MIGQILQGTPSRYPRCHSLHPRHGRYPDRFPILSFFSTRSRIPQSSFRNSFPSPSLAGHRFKKHRCSLVFGPFFSFSISAIMRTPASAPCPTWLPDENYNNFPVSIHTSGHLPSSPWQNPGYFPLPHMHSVYYGACATIFPTLYSSVSSEIYAHPPDRSPFARPPLSFCGKKCKRISPVRDHLACHPGIAFG